MDSIDSFAEWTNSTVKYDPTVENEYLSYGLVAEVGELAGDMAKYYRGDYDYVELRKRVKKELGDAFWFLARMCVYNGWKPSEVLDVNMDKLEGRLRDNTIKGDDDNRGNML